MSFQPPMPLYATQLARVHGLAHGFSTRLGGVSRCYRPHLPQDQGDLNLGFTKDDDRENVRTNRTRFLSAIDGSDFRHFGLLVQQHTPTIHALRSLAEAATSFTLPAITPGDGLITNIPGLLLTVQIADCVPVLVYDKGRRAIGAFHAGWRGTVARIVEHGIAAMTAEYNTAPADILAAIGPSIGPASYKVGEEVHTAFTTNFPYASELFSADMNLDLWEANRRQLLTAGVLAENITILAEDTAADTAHFFSHRAENGHTGRMMAAIGIRA
jgi:YfiH family protein